MSRETFHNLLKRYLEGNCTEQEKKIVEQWYGMLDDEDLADISKAELSIIDEKLWSAINSKVSKQNNTQTGTPGKSIRPLWIMLALAASITGIIALCIYWLYTPVATHDFLADKTNLVKKINTSSQAIEIQLEDGSFVRLEPNSELMYPKSFEASKREVLVRGEAFFHVKNDPSRPFYVFSKDLITQVVGTSFIVKANDQLDNEVSVLTGKVIVSRKEEKRFYHNLISPNSGQVVLTPNQMVTYRQRTHELVVSLVKNPQPIASSKQENQPVNYVFNETSMETVLTALEETYGVEIEVEEKAVFKCTFTGDIKDQDLYTRLDLICQSVGATYEVEGTDILIMGGRCQ